MERTLAIIGGGPKGLAIAAKAVALRRLGLEPPHVVVVDRAAPAANWTGEQGHTDGLRTLGTSPDKDVGFPYFSSCWSGVNSRVNEEMLSFSFQRHMVACGAFSDWVDQGRPQPNHATWGRYLRWVHERLTASDGSYSYVNANVTGLQTEQERWRLILSTGDPLQADGLVVTGPGDARRVDETAEAHERILDGRTFWSHLDEIEALVPVRPTSPRGRDKVDKPVVCVIGGGETAAAVCVGLVERLRDRVRIEIISPGGVTYSRGESFEENRVYTAPESEYITWSELDAEHRRQFMGRTDRGVFSVDAKEVLSRSRDLFTIPGKVRRLRAAEDDSSVHATIGYVTRPEETVSYDVVVDAVGFNPLSFTKLFNEPAHAAFSKAIEGDATSGDLRSRVEQRIAGDLSVSELRPRLHLPMLAGFAQGPGFPNLSCLGLLSDRVLRSYVDAARAT